MRRPHPVAHNCVVIASNASGAETQKLKAARSRQDVNLHLRIATFESGGGRSAVLLARVMAHYLNKARVQGLLRASPCSFTKGSLIHFRKVPVRLYKELGCKPLHLLVEWGAANLLWVG